MNVIGRAMRQNSPASAAAPIKFVNVFAVISFEARAKSASIRTGYYYALLPSSSIL